jgi:uncharacterized protein
VKALLFAFVAGGLFGAGLLLSGMTMPSRVLGFLDVFGAWDPTLAFVMVGAIGVHALGLRAVLSRRAPLFAERFAEPSARGVDRRLALGAATFGVGWGLVGYCPGPALVSAGSVSTAPLVFVAAMALGSVLANRLVSS